MTSHQLPEGWNDYSWKPVLRKGPDSFSGVADAMNILKHCTVHVELKSLKPASIDPLDKTPPRKKVKLIQRGYVKNQKNEVLFLTSRVNGISHSVSI